ncbi:hypothetical protein DM860_002972 [Cuscuta australis]|uniref:Retrotransposon gag domain-containing protein n=1 Tax=Cuscuta australis TaxID=267555 RepID=A0A328D4Y8_9ASTE|nr:hypothetical protein DM860_002972 [Cuscuta australis]
MSAEVTQGEEVSSLRQSVAHMQRDMELRFSRLEALLLASSGSPSTHDQQKDNRRECDTPAKPNAGYVPKPKLEPPKCDGYDPLRWLYKVQEYFQFYDTPPEERLRCVALMLEGAAADWFRWRRTNNLLAGWEDFVDKFKLRFDSQHYVDYLGQLAKLRQRGTVMEYQGPGCSSVGYGESQEIGPFLIGGGDGPLLTINPFSWNTEANILFLESPFGVGFSYSNTTTDFVNLGDELAGQYIPVLADLILEKNKKPSSSNLSTNINLKGVMIGNPETSDAEDWRGMVDYAWSHAIISDETHKIITDNCNNFSTSDVWNNKNCSDGVDEMLKQYDEIDIYSLYTPKCLNNLTSSSLSPSLSSSPSSSSHKIGRRRGRGLLGLVGAGYDPCLDDYTVSYFRRGDVQKVLHANDGLHVKDWNICNDSIFNAWAYSNESVLPIYRKLIAAGQKILLYSGDTDGRVPVLSTRYSIAAMGLPITKPWAPWYYQKEVSGWVQEYKGLTFATVRGAGHDVPTFKPAESLALFSSFICGLPLPSRRGP